MKRIVAERWLAVVLVIFIVAISCYTTWRMCQPMGPEIPEQAWQILQVHNEVQDAGFEYAQQLSAEGRHEEAAWVMMDLAGMQRSFDRVGHSKASKVTEIKATSPSWLELSALRKCKQASPELRAAYVALLKRRYPNWPPTKSSLAVELDKLSRDIADGAMKNMKIELPWWFIFADPRVIGVLAIIVLGLILGTILIKKRKAVPSS